MPARVTSLHEQQDWYSLVSCGFTSLPEPFCRLSRGCPSPPPPPSSPVVQAHSPAFRSWGCVWLPPTACSRRCPWHPKPLGQLARASALCSRLDEYKVASLVGEAVTVVRHHPFRCWAELGTLGARISNSAFLPGMPSLVPETKADVDVVPSFSTSRSLSESVCEGYWCFVHRIFFLRNISQLWKEKNCSCHQFCLQTLSHFLAVEFISGALAPSCTPRMKRLVVLVVSNEYTILNKFST